MGFRGQGSGFRAQGPGFRGWGSGVGVRVGIDGVGNKIEVSPEATPTQVEGLKLYALTLGEPYTLTLKEPHNLTHTLTLRKPYALTQREPYTLTRLPYTPKPEP